MHSQINRLTQSLRIVAALALVLPGQAKDPQSAPLELSDSRVIAAGRSAWIEAHHGRSGLEASFRLDGDATAYRIVATPPTNQQRGQSLQVIPGVTFAVFHVHTTKGDPAPSKPDRAVADRFKLRMYTIHRDGLFLYDPATMQTTQLEQGVAWMDRAPRSGKNLALTFEPEETKR
jgi:hypothetical protein